MKGLSLAVLIAAPSEAALDSLAILRDALGDAIELSPSPDELRYCPDNTCEAFQAADAEARADFALLYLHRVSSYIYLEPWRSRAGLAAIQSVVDRHRGVCGSGYDVSVTACVLSGMRKRYSVEVFLLRYDEGVLSREKATGLREHD